MNELEEALLQAVTLNERRFAALRYAANILNPAGCSETAIAARALILLAEQIGEQILAEGTVTSFKPPSEDAVRDSRGDAS